MKKLLTILLSLVIITAQANTIEIIPKTTEHAGFVVVKNNHFSQGQMAIVFLPGIGERGSGSIADLKRISVTGYANAYRDSASFFAAADYFGFNIVMVQPKNLYEYGEIKDAINYALNVLQADPTRLHAACYSLGGFGMLRETGKDATLPDPFATITFFNSGPGAIAASGSNLGKSKIPILFVTSKDDSLVGTHPKFTIAAYNEAKAAEGNCWLTIYNKKGHSGFTAVVGAWGTKRPAPGFWLPFSASVATGMTNPKFVWYEWLKSTVKGSVIDPSTFIPTAPIIPIPVPEPPVIESVSDSLNITVPKLHKKPTQIIILYDDSTYYRAGIAN